MYTGSHVAAAEHFRLSKWYFDCTDQDGHALVAYRAELYWRAVHLHYAAVVCGFVLAPRVTRADSAGRHAPLTGPRA